MRKSKKSSFRGKVRNNVEATSNNGVSKYLKLPKGIQLYNPTPGAREKIDIIPYEVSAKTHSDSNKDLEIAVPGSLWYKRPFLVHKDVGVDKERVICLRTFGKPCPICEYKAKRAKEGADQEELKAYYASQRVLYNVIPRGVKKVDEEIRIMDISYHLFQKYLNEEIDENENYEIFPDLEEGLTLKIRWSEESFAGHKYAECGRIDFEKREPIDEDLVSDVPDLDSCLKELTYDDMETLFLEMNGGSVSDDDDDDDEKPVRKKKAVEKPFEDEDEDEDEKPVRKKKASKKVEPEPDEDDDEDEEPEPEDEDDDDDDDEEPIKPKKASKKAPKVPTVEELMEMESSDFIDVITALKLDIDVDDYNDENEIREAIAEELGLELPKPKKAGKKKTAKKVEPDEDEDEEPAPVKKPAKKETKKGGCPFGHTFGKDCDSTDDCDDCDKWNECMDAKESM